MCGFQTLEQEVVKLKFPWRPQDVRDDRVMGYMLRKSANRECDVIFFLKKVYSKFQASPGNMRLYIKHTNRQPQFPVRYWAQ